MAYIADDATESVGEHSSKLRPLTNLHAPVTALFSAALASNVLPQRDEGLGEPCAID